MNDPAPSTANSVHGTGRRPRRETVELRFPRIEDLHRAQRRLVERNYDDWNLVTGRVGKGKSTWARKNCWKLDPAWKDIETAVSHIHFNEDDFWDDYITLKPGSCIILDEFDAHRRRAMHGERVTFLERMKRTRSRRVHAWIIYDRVSSIDRDLITDRNAFWHHVEERGLMEIRQPHTSLRFTDSGEPIEPTKHPQVGRFPFTAWEPPGLEAAYQAKKDREINIFGRTERVEEDPWLKPDPLLLEIAKRRLGL